MCLRSPIAVSWLVALASQKVPHRAPTPPDPYCHCPPLINPSKRIPAISIAIWRGSFAEGTKDLGIEYSAIFVQTSNSFIICLCCTQIYEWVSVAVLFLTEFCPFLHFGRFGAVCKGSFTFEWNLKTACHGVDCSAHPSHPGSPH